MKKIISRLFGSTSQEISPAAADVAKGPEAMMRANRVVIFGTNWGGLRILEEELSKFFTDQGISETEMVGIRFRENIERAFFGQLPKEGEEIPERTLPQGVIALPEMRTNGYGMHGNMTIPTPVKDIAQLCAEHEVPFVIVERSATEATMGNIALQLTQQVQQHQLPSSHSEV
ncbi:MAG TPA: hypothetical protein VLE73_04800 [Candidatus Saccharimonadales bacterium]|nr:hypothetical protein [Candidatus Saccharimonadales bacterium]